MADHDKIEIMPVADVTAYDNFAKRIIGDIASALGLTFEQMGGRFHTGGVVRSGSGLSKIEVPAMLSNEYLVPRERFFRLRVVWLVGYNPQKLLEDKR